MRCPSARRPGGQEGGAGLLVPLPALAGTTFWLMIRNPFPQKSRCLHPCLYWLGIKSESTAVKQVVSARLPLSLSGKDTTHETPCVLNSYSGSSSMVYITHKLLTFSQPTIVGGGIYFQQLIGKMQTTGELPKL